jgi:DNA mismatch endonuclease (patch repair protein)
MDVFDREKRSQIMSRISGKDTKPELVVRSLLHKMGYRYRLHRSDLPGKPDITLPKHKKAILIHGCFWHAHNGCSRSKRPGTNRLFWERKLDGNILRDKTNILKLKNLGWGVLIIWTCEIKEKTILRDRLVSFLTKQ